MKRILSGLFITMIVMLFGLKSYATHIFGMDLGYTWLHDSTYKITLTVFGDCAPSGASSFAQLPSATPTICIYKGSATSVTSTFNLAVESPSTGTEVTPVCTDSAAHTQCSSTTSTIPGIKKFTYSATYTFPSRSNAWRIIFNGAMGSSSAGRSATIDNITSAGSQVIFLCDTLNNTSYSNTSPNLTVLPTPFFCTNRSNNYNPGAVDADSDSLTFSLVTGKIGSGGGGGGGGGGCTSTASNVTYVSGASAGAPIRTTSAYSFNSANGQISYTTTLQQRSLGVYTVREYRGGVLVGTSQREMTFLILPCTTTPPSGYISSATNATINDTTHISACAETGTMSFRINPTASDTFKTITITSAGIPASASYVITNNGTNHATSQFTWNTTGVAAGTYTFYLTFTDNACPLSGTNTMAYTITINPQPSAGVITGSVDSVCVGSSITYSDTASGGTWSSALGLATVSSSGVVTGITTGLDTIKYSVTNICATAVARKVVFVKALPDAGAISGTNTVCPGSSVSLSETVTGGTWTTVFPAIASVSTTGVVTGVANGVDTIKYTVINSCGTAVARFVVTVNASPSAGTISGATTVCQGATTTLTSTVTGGSWSSVFPAIATINTIGVVTGVSSGVDTIKYIISQTCGSDTARFVIRVNPLPAVGPISGPVTVCVGANITLTDTASGGVWSSVFPAIATVNSTGVVTGVSAGVDTIKYTVTNSCGTMVARYTITVNPLADAGVITSPSNMCPGDTITFTETVSGGTWSSGNIAIASVNAATGKVYAVAVGAVNITYSVTNTCGTATVFEPLAVNSVPNAGLITGPTSVCPGANITLTDSVTGGRWTSGTVSVASVNNITGVVTGVAAGTAIITYTVTTTCGSASDTMLITVNPLPNAGTITGTQVVCPGSNTTLSNATTGGTWSTSNASIASVNTSGLVTGVAAGTAIVSYAVTNVCGTAIDTALITVNPMPNAGLITGSNQVCIGLSNALSESVTGGVWSVNNAVRASISTSGVVTGLTSGTFIVSYTVTNSCGSATDTMVMTSLPAPNAGTITGTQTVCVGANTTLSNATTGGVWSGSNIEIAVVDGSGVVTGMGAGVQIISYTVTNSCGSVSDTALITVLPLPVTGTITGANTVCAGANTTLSNTTTGGTWGTSNATIASVNTTGLVNGVAAGSAIISYTVTNSCGAASDTLLMTVNALPNAGTITGTTTVCQGANTTLADATTGGTWSSGNTAIATVSAGGVVTGVAGGSTNITYTVTNACGTANTSVPVTVNPLPVVGPITGTTTVCPGGTTTYADTTAGGIWASADNTIATVGTAGLVTGVANGVTTISYTVTNSCGSTTVTRGVTVNSTPNAGTISGPSSVCVSSSITLTSTVTGGTWSATNSHASVVATTGLVGGVSLGLDTLVYTITTTCGTANSTYVVNVGAPTTAGAIVGPHNVCVGATITMTDTVSGGTWSSSNTTIASVNTSGVVTGRASGTAIITYVISSSCGAALDTQLVVVSPAPNAGTIGGPSTVCVGATITLTNATTGGTWSSSDATQATVSTTGAVTGVATGAVNISYSVTNSCSTAVATYPVTINPALDAGTISGATSVCVGNTTTLTESATGGSWSTSSASIASVNASGVVTGVSGGTANITYSVTSSCGTAFDTLVMTVNPTADAGSIAGPTNVCIGASIVLTDATTGGTWSSSDATVATVSTTGTVTGVANGAVTISYTVTNSCGTASATANVNVSLVADAGTITGATTVCTGANTTYTESVSGGSWSSSDPSVATISTTGVITGVTVGAATITYTVTTGCGTAFTTTTINVGTTPTAGSISGPSDVCVGANITLSDATSGGTWSTGNASIATVNTTGVVTGVGAGTTNISYSVTNTCGTANATAVVNVSAAPNAGTISGTSTVCVGNTVTLSTTGTGGTWSTGNAAIASVNGSGVVTGVASGSVNITYTVTTACSTATATYPVTVNPLPNAGSISGAAPICIGSSITLTDGVSGGTWSSGSTGIATVSTTGSVTGVSNGTATISYTVTNSCGNASATASINVSPTANAGTLSGTTTICVGNTTTLSSTVSGGTWTSGSPSVAPVSSGGVVLGLSTGTATITYTVTTACASAFTTATITVNPAASAGTIAGPSSVCVGANIALTDGVAGGTWSSSNSGIATVSTTGAVTGVSAGAAVISYSVTNSCGTANATANVTVNPLASAGTISGSAAVCVGASSTLSASATGGTWSTSDASVVTVSTTGTITGVSAGAATITYSVSSSCGSGFTTIAATVNSAPDAGSITGASSVCVGSSVALSNTASGGTWSSSNASVATVSTTGMVTGVTTGSATISYTVTNSCGTANAVRTMTVDVVANAGTVSGPATVCQAASITLSSTATGGTWSSSDVTIATVSAGGVVTGVAGGSATISYTVTTGCSSATATAGVTVNPLADAGTITGSASMCAGTTATLTESVTGGTWSSTNPSVVSIDASGNVSALALGTATISYSVTNSCGTRAATLTINVSNLPTAGTISGTTAICRGFTTTLSETVSGGTWSSSNASIASVSTSGVVYGAAAGTATISYSVSTACSTAVATTPVVVSVFPSAGTIAGPATICLGTPTTYVDTTAGGVWSSGDTTVARVNASGVVTGVATGTVNIYYSVINACGATNVTVSITVMTAPSAGSISGPASVCPGATVTLSETVSGGIWSSSDSSIASISSAGVVTGVASGSATISYGISSSCGMYYTTAPMSVISAPNAGVISGTTTICPAATSALSETVPGGTWSTSDATVASVSTTGVVTGVSNGTATISYAVTGACTTAYATTTVTVNPSATAGTLTGPSSICISATGSFSSTVAGGTWSSSATSIATVNTAGVVYGVAVGSATISYSVSSSCGTATSTMAVAVVTTPYEGFITGSTSVCESATSTMVETVTGGTWSTSSAATASVDTSGVVTGIAAGTAIISYTVTNGCGMAIATAYITVSPLPSAGTITGSSALCMGTPATMTDTVTGGTWSISDATVATITSAGIVTPLTVGSAVISYTKTNTCGTSSATHSITIDVAPSTAGTITAPATMCPGTTGTATSSVSGGTWSISDATIATVNSTGTVTAIAAGSATISYTIANGCGSVTATSALTVDPSASAGTISSATTSVCEGGSIALSVSGSGGSWSTSDASVASVDASGTVTAVAAGTVNISYTVSGSCGSAAAGVTINVNPTPVLSAISGPRTICTGTTATLSNTYSGGTWSSSDASVATIDAAAGVIGGVATGVVTITYTATNAFGCSATTTVTDTVNLSPDAGTISASSTSACAGATITMTDAAAGGTWSTSDPLVASVDASGAVVGVASGSATISYSVTNSCGTATATVGVSIMPVPTVGTMSGATSLCAGTTTTLTNSAAGGSWSSSDATVATVNSTGDVTGIASGVAIISYTITNSYGCSATATQADTVSPAVSAGTISAAGTTFCAGTSVALTNAVTGGSWSSSDASVATVDASGNVTGIAGGAVTITYSVSSSFGCSAYTTVDLTVNPAPSVSGIMGGTSLCLGGTQTLSNTTFGGVWSSSNPSVASISSTGIVTGVAMGVVTISYTVTNVYGCSTTVTAVDTVSVLPILTGIGGPAVVCEHAAVTLSNGVAGGTWSSADTTIATIDATSGILTGVGAGTVTISYTLASSAGCSVTRTTSETVDPAPVVAAITGTSAGCPATTSTLADATTGGSWSSSNAAIATVNATGDVTAVAAGSAVIYYTVTNGFGCSTSATDTFTVYPNPALSPISGTGNACLGAVVTVSDTAAGGVWSTDDASVASIDPTTGSVYGVSLGTTTITYMVISSYGCVATTTMGITVNPLPVAGAIHGATNVCESANITYSADSTGGVWSSADASIASVDAATGAVTGVAAGTVNITYTVTNAAGCNGVTIASVTVDAAPVVSAISGSSAICLGSPATYTNATAGGTWSVDDITLATISTTGTATGIAAGSVTISYSVTNAAGCNATVTMAATVSVPPTVSAITGASVLCAGSATVMTNATTGGTWSSSNPATATVDATGNVYGMSGGTATISYTVTNAAGCSVSATSGITVNALPVIAAISGPTGVCIGNTATYTTTTTGGSWSVSTTSIATVSTSGVVTGITAGTVTLTYSVTSGAGCTAEAYRTITVNAAPTGTLLPASGSLTLCDGNPVNIVVTGASASSSFQWYINGSAIAGATNSGYNTDSAGFYSVSVSEGGCSILLSGVTVQLPPNAVILHGSGNILYTGSFATYQWFLNGSAIAGATNSVYLENNTGSYTVVVTDANGCTDTSAALWVNHGGTGVSQVGVMDIKMYPNPATSLISIEAPVAVNVSIYSPDGKLIVRKENATSVDVSNLASGMYMIMIYDTANNLIKTDRFVKAE